MYTTNPTQLLEMQKSQFNAFQALGTTAFQATEKLAQLHLSTTRSLLEEGTDAAHSLLSAKDPQEFTAIATSLAQPSTEKLAQYARSAYGIATAAGTEISKVLEAQIAEGNRKISEIIDQTARSAPAGSEQAISLWRNTVSAANTTFDTLVKTARQAVETTESSVAAAVAVATDAAKSKAKKTTA